MPALKLTVGRPVMVYRWWQDPVTKEYRWMTGTIQNVGASLVVVKLENGHVQSFPVKDLGRLRR